MSDNKYDLAVLGGGPGGYAAAIRAAQMGAKVALIEKGRPGGTCLNLGCIPTKALIACVNLYERIQRAESFGITTGAVSIDLGAVIERKNKIIDKLVKNLEFLIRKNNIELISGNGTVTEPGKIEVTGNDRKSSVESKKLVLAMGSYPVCLPGLSFDGRQFLSSNNLLENREVFKKLDIVGGGIIGIHFAQFFASLGSEITIYEALPEILPGVDEEVVAQVKRLLKRKNVTVLTGARFDPKQSSGKTLICVGRAPNVHGVEALNLKTEKRSIAVNEKMETSAPGVYAVGDLVSKKMLAHVAYEQGVIAAENALGGNKTFSYDCIPFGIYTSPEIGSVGLTEKEAREKFGDVKIGKFPFGALGIAQAMGEIEGFIKVISNEAGEILGVHILGPEATSLVGIAAAAIRNKIKADKLGETFQAHPSYPEGVQEAVENLFKRSLHIIN